MAVFFFFFFAFCFRVCTAAVLFSFTAPGMSPPFTYPSSTSHVLYALRAMLCYAMARKDMLL